MYLLKDFQTKNTYSNYLNTDDSFDNSSYPENKLEYGKEVDIKTQSFKKEVYNEVPYTILPAEFSGTAINRLNVGNSHLIFKTKAIKGAGLIGSPIATHFFLFTVPKKFKTKPTLNFLYYKYPTSWNSDENQGIYVIRKIK